MNKEILVKTIEREKGEIFSNEYCETYLREYPSTIIPCMYEILVKATRELSNNRLIDIHKEVGSKIKKSIESRFEGLEIDGKIDLSKEVATKYAMMVVDNDGIVDIVPPPIRNIENQIIPPTNYVGKITLMATQFRIQVIGIEDIILSYCVHNILISMSEDSSGPKGVYTTAKDILIGNRFDRLSEITTKLFKTIIEQVNKIPTYKYDLETRILLTKDPVKTVKDFMARELNVYGSTNVMKRRMGVTGKIKINSVYLIYSRSDKKFRYGKNVTPMDRYLHISWNNHGIFTVRMSKSMSETVAKEVLENSKVNIV